MSKICNLIRELCPNGVKYYQLAELEDNKKILLGRGNIISKMDIRDNPGDYPVYSSSATGNGEIGRYGKYMFDDVRISWSIDGGGKFFYRDDPKYSITNVSGWLKVMDDSFVDVKYLYYVLSNEWKNKIYDYTHKAHPSVIRKEYYIPIPEIEIQKEIVYILDKFTNLEKELEEELEYRNKQFEYWKDQIFKFKNRKDVKWLKLGDIKTDIYRGSGIKRDEVTEEGIPCVRYGEIYTTYNIWFDKCKSHTASDVVNKPKTFTNNDLLFAITGESVEEIAKTIVYTGNETCYAGGDIVVMKHNQNGKYLSYALSTSDAISQKGKGKVKSKVVHSSVPSIEEQEEIVKKLDCFYDLINNLDFGLPAEIELRKKQFEYYRNKLLSFEELSVSE